MTVSPVFPLRIFYDGSCSVCTREVERYGRKDRDGRLILLDITAPGFDPAPFGITLAEFMYQMHVQRMLEGSPAVLGLFWKIPFSDTPPKYIRLEVCRYHFTDPDTKRFSGRCWNRTEIGKSEPMTFKR